MSDTRDTERAAAATYERIADAYAAKVETKAHHAYYDRPAVISLWPEVAGRHVLDAGCGPGPGTASGAAADGGFPAG